jgi:hypothetical protein
LVVTALGEQITSVFGGLRPLILHATVVGVLSGLAVWLVSQQRLHTTVRLLCPMLGAAIWTGSTVINLLVRENLDENVWLVGASAVLGAIAGAMASPLPNAIVAARNSSAGDAYRHARAWIGVWTVTSGSLLMLTRGMPRTLPTLAITLGLMILAPGLIVDLRERAWLSKVRAGSSSGWRIGPAGEADYGLPAVWAGDEVADQVLIERAPQNGSVYRSASTERSLGRLTDRSTPHAVERRMTLIWMAGACTIIALSLPWLWR